MYDKKSADKSYYHRTKEQRKPIRYAYYLRKKEHIKNYRKINKEKFDACAKKRRAKCIAEWESYFPKKINCPICDTEIFFNVKDYKIAIHFDHREGGSEAIKYHPSLFLYSHKRCPEYEKIWESCNFGMLCRRCNLHLPTKNREEYVRKVVKYVFGKNFEIKETSSVQ